MLELRGLLGIAVLVGVAWLLSSNRRRFPWKIVLVGLALQWVLAWFVLRTDPGERIFRAIGHVVTAVLTGADQGAAFVFKPFGAGDVAATWIGAGIKIMTTIILVATLSSIGYHYGVLQRVVAAMAWVLRRSMGISGAESLAGAANVFFGQTEAPLLVRPYISKMTRSELMALMTGGFATVAAGVMAVYVGILAGEGPDRAERAVTIARHLLTACLMSAPAAFVMAKVMVPETAEALSGGSAKVALERESDSLVDAITQGASQGMKLAINVLAMLIAFIALLSVVNLGLEALGNTRFVAPAVAWMGLEKLDLTGLLGLLFSPIAWLIGVDTPDCRLFGSLLGRAMVLNELIAYPALHAAAQDGQMSERSVVVATYALCGFANFSSIGIQIGGIGVLAPDRRKDLVRLGPRAMLGGALACWTTACIAGVLVR